jgi:hypothetical protein
MAHSCLEIFRPVQNCFKLHIAFYLYRVFLSFLAYYLIKISYYGFFDPTRGVIQDNSPVGILLFGVMWALFLGVFSFAISYKSRKNLFDDGF